MTNHEKRVELHLHTKFTKMDALIDVNELIRRAADEEWPAVAITDLNSVQAFPEAQLAAKEYGVKVIYGLEAYYCPDAIEAISCKYYHIILLVNNKVGLKNLYKLVSYANTEIFDGVPRIPKSVLEKHRDGLLVGSACNSGELFDALLSGKTTHELEKIAAFYDYLEIQPICNNRFFIHNGTVQNDKALRKLNIEIAEIAKRIHRPLVATGDVHFLDPEDELTRSVLLSAKGIKNIAVPLPLYYKSTEEMLEEFSYLGEDAAYSAVVTNTSAIADSIEFVEPVPYGIYPPRIDGAADEINQESTTKAQELYGRPLPAPVKKRLDCELTIIKKNQIGVCFTITKRLIKRSRKNGFHVESRGNAATSLVAYLIGITEINPLAPHYICDNCMFSEFEQTGTYITGFELPDKSCPVCGEIIRKEGFNIPFEAFFAEYSSKILNFNLNFASSYQKQASEHLIEIFGSEHILRAGKVHAVSTRLAQKYAEMFALKNGLMLREDEIKTISSKICGVTCNYWPHPGAYFIIPYGMEAVDFCPIEKWSSEYVTHFDSSSLKKCLIRFDILGHNTPTLLKELEEITGTDSCTIPLNDEATLRLYETSDTVALPEFDSDFARQLLKKIKPSHISELIKVSGLIHGTGTWNRNAENLIDSGVATIRDVISTSDDIFFYLVSMGINQHDAYGVMEFVQNGKFHVDTETCHSNDARVQQTEVEEILRRHEVPCWYIESMKKIKYLSPKAHISEYVLMSFRIAWYKAHYPLEFYVTFLNRIEEGTFKPDDFINKTDTLKCEIKHLSKESDIMHNIGYESDRYKGLKVICDVYEHGFCFVPRNLHGKNGFKYIFALCNEHSICVFEPLVSN